MHNCKELSVYSCLYDIVEANMFSANETFEYSKNTFLCDVMAHPQEIDVFKYTKLSNRDFFEAVYVGVMKRCPDKKTIKYWERKFNDPKEKFQKEFLLYVERSTVTAINQIHFIGNPYFKQKCGIKYYFLGLLYGLTDKSNLREIGKKLPEPIQKLIRKVFL